MQTPLASIMLALALVASLAWISRANWWENHSTVGRQIALSVAPTELPSDWDIDERLLAAVIWDDGLPTLLRDDPLQAKHAYPMWAEIAFEHLEQGRPTMLLCRIEGGRRWGVWAVTHEILYEPYSYNSPSSEQKTDARRVFSAVEGRDVGHVSLLWSGYVINAVTLIAAVAFVVSLAWFPRLRAKRLADRRLAIGMCPKCRYDLTGITKSVCPECGTPTGITA